METSRASQDSCSSSKTHTLGLPSELADDIVKNETESEDDFPNSQEPTVESPSGFGSVVAAHYNNLEEKGLDERKNSRIFHLRNFNNWVKSMLIKENLTKLQRSSRESSLSLKVLDMCCGKGGDLLKWRKGNIKHLICADIAATSVEQCKSRFEDLKGKCERNWNSKLFSCEFITADCTKVRLREKYSDVTMKLDLVSCQFSFHYCFESLPQAECMLKNASECLRTGGYFIGTIPDSADIIKRIEETGSNKLQNSLFSIELCCDKPYPLFGAKYNFYLEGVVNCPEFLVHFPTLERLAARFGLKLVNRERFSDFYSRMKDEGMFLLKRMNALETYPPIDGVNLVGSKADYEHAEEYLHQFRYPQTLGTLSKPEWEAISLYQIFVFEKLKTSWSAEGKPEFDF